MNNPHAYFQLMLTALRNADYELPANDAHCAEIIRDALEQYSRDEQNLPEAREYAEFMQCSFDMLRYDIEEDNNEPT